MAKRAKTRPKYRRWIGWIAGAVVVGSSVAYGKRLAKMASKIVVETRSDFDQNTFSYLIYVTIKKPCESEHSGEIPFIKLNYQDTTLASSTPKSDILTIPANGVSQTTLRIAFDRDKLITSFPAAAAILFAGGKMDVSAITESGLVTTVGTFEFSKVQTWKLGW